MYLRNQKKNCRWKFSSGKSSSSYHLTWTLDCLNSWSLSDPVDWMAAANWLVVVSQPIWKSMRKSKWGKSSPSFGVKIPKKKIVATNQIISHAWNVQWFLKIKDIRNHHLVNVWVSTTTFTFQNHGRVTATNLHRQGVSVRTSSPGEQQGITWLFSRYTYK